MTSTEEKRVRGLLPHDLLLLDRVESFLPQDELPSWLLEVLAETRVVVVRRGLRQNNLIPVGVRGRTRAQRCAGYLDPTHILESITPEDLVRERSWEKSSRRDEIAAIRSLSRLHQLWEQFHLSWGPTGSVGFELATGAPVARAGSDLDLRILAPEPIPVAPLKEMLALAESREHRVDIQIETPQGSVALMEYVSGSARMLLKTNRGSILVRDPWAVVVDTKENP